MAIAELRSTSKRLTGITTLLATLALLLSMTTVASTQTERTPVTMTSSADAMLSLPDAPSFTTSSSGALDDTASSANGDITNPSDTDAAATETVKHHWLLARRRDMTVLPGDVAPPLSNSSKVALGLKQSFTFFSVVGWVTSAGYSQVTNRSPNYGTDSGAFGMRLGATALRNISENIFSNVIFAPIFHEDPRYYKMGNKHSVIKRALYASSRALITRTDDGRATPNYSVISGNLAGAALTNAYYPSRNVSFSTTAETFGTSMAGSAIGFIVTEFLNDALRRAHLQKLE